MNYALLLGDVKECSKDKLKELIFELSQRDYQSIKELDISDDVKKELIVMSQNRTFFEMLLVNALK
nr:MAG TPA: hypothetical protein [Caudoviricetes sp.]